MRVTLDKSTGAMYIFVREEETPESNPGYSPVLVTDVINDECNLDRRPMTGELWGIEILNVDLEVTGGGIRGFLHDLWRSWRAWLTLRWPV